MSKKQPPSGREAGDDGTMRGGEAWKEHTKAIERVIDVALTLDEPRSVSWISDQAHVAEATARDHLELLTDQLGVIASTTAHGVTKYQPDELYFRYLEVSQRIEGSDKDELAQHAADLQEQIAECEEQYDAEDPDELRTRIAEEDTTAEQAREYRQVASEWETLKYRLSIIREALDRYDQYGERAHVHA